MINLSNQDPHDGALRDLMPDLTPMLDILFILLLFLMLSSGVIFKSLNLALPSGNNEKLQNYQETTHVILEIHQNYYLIDDKRVSDIEALKKMVKDLKLSESEKELVIAGDKNVAIQRLLDVLTFLQNQNIKSANILMKKNHD